VLSIHSLISKITRQTHSGAALCPCFKKGQKRAGKSRISERPGTHRGHQIRCLLLLIERHSARPYSRGLLGVHLATRFHGGNTSSNPVGGANKIKRASTRREVSQVRTCLRDRHLVTGRSRTEFERVRIAPMRTQSGTGNPNRDLMSARWRRISPVCCRGSALW
jgi:hypothetical protein